MSAFGLHSVRECATLIDLVGNKNAHEIAAVPVVVDVQVETKGGTVISWGRDRPLSVTTGRGGRGGGGRGLGNSNTATAHYGVDDMPHAKHGADGNEIKGRDF